MALNIRCFVVKVLVKKIIVKNGVKIFLLFKFLLKEGWGQWCKKMVLFAWMYHFVLCYYIFGFAQFMHILVKLWILHLACLHKENPTKFEFYPTGIFSLYWRQLGLWYECNTPNSTFFFWMFLSLSYNLFDERAKHYK